jgi:hypothetical protein
MEAFYFCEIRILAQELDELRLRNAIAKVAGDFGLALFVDREEGVMFRRAPGLDVPEAFQSPENARIGMGVHEIRL